MPDRRVVPVGPDGMHADPRMLLVHLLNLDANGKSDWTHFCIYDSGGSTAKCNVVQADFG